ncbi:MAG: hypothetical protein JNM18_05685 [Planctomycetaceae bacterium]|nr:hypothetical protein [Planctomycetaceae bacterium]
MATLFRFAKSFWRFAYEPPRKIDARKNQFTPPGLWFDATVVTLAFVLGISTML